MRERKIMDHSIENHVEELAQIGNHGTNPKQGFTRASWSDEESKAMQYFADYLSTHGFISNYDEVGNLFIRAPGEFEQVIQVGSHLDTVPKGGNYDGAVGIICGAEALLRVYQGNLDKLSTGLELVIWRGEESATYNTAFKGSLAAFGKLPKETLAYTYKSQPLEKAITEQGYSVAPILNSQPTISTEQLDKIKAHFEVHIEQSIKLEKDDLDIGVVTSIRGPKRYRVSFYGEAAHSGATPMGVKYRKDANLALAHLQVELDNLANSFMDSGKDIIQTIGVVNCDKEFNEKYPEIFTNGITKVSPFAYFLIDFRSSNKEDLETYDKAFKESINKISKKFNVESKEELLSEGEPLENLDPKLQQLAKETAEKLNLKSELIPSGAGHDIAVVANQSRSNGTNISCSLLFIPCKNGVSHNPEEYASIGAISKATELLTNVISRLI